ncbi:hypothetical protein ACMFMG_005880 [Clarireedia jacksonii]
MPSELCWPSASDWNSFNETINGRLIRSVPPASVCYPAESNYNVTACEYVLSHWNTSVFHSADPVSVASPWTNNTCNPIYPNGTSVAGDPEAGKKGCSLGSLPPYVVNATEPSHVQAALKFATTWNLRTNIKNTGHNDSGRIWTHNMKGIKFHKDFQPQNCSRNSTASSSQMAATLGAGVQDGEVLDAMKQNNVIAVTGTSMDVGVVGWSTGGGHGILTGEYGMGADNILEAVIVTPNGELLTANHCQNEDIFWAIRGGGGGTFGVILSMMMKVYPEPVVDVHALSIIANNGTSSKLWWKLIAQVHALLPQLQDQGLSGYYTMGGPPSSATFQCAGSLFLFNKLNGTFDNVIRPLQQLLAAANDTVTHSFAPIPLTNYYDLLELLPASENVGKETTITASRLITRRAVTEDLDLVAQTFEEIGPQAMPPLVKPTAQYREN